MPNEDQARTIEAKLRRALVECQKRYGISVEAACKCLTDVPPVLLLPNDEANELLDLDARASLLRFSQGRFSEAETAQWDQFDKKERRSAHKVAAFLDSERQFPRQRPSHINLRLALYLIFAFEALLDRKLPFSRPSSGGAPRGPAFTAVMAAIALTQARAESYTEHADSSKLNRAGLADIIEITRTKEFHCLLRAQGFDRTPASVLANGHSIALTIALARKRIVAARTRRRKKTRTY
jgi:hypothetical protein